MLGSKKTALLNIVAGRRTLLLILGIALAISLIMTVVTYKTPTTITTKTTVSKIVHEASFSYTVKVVPALIYGNATELGEGIPLYLKLLREIDLTMSYKAWSPEGIAKIKGSVTPLLELRSGSWTKTMKLTESIPINETKTTMNVNLNISDILHTIGIIEEETGVRVDKYNISVIMTISEDMTLQNGREYKQEFKPAYSLKVEEDRGRVTVGNTEQRKVFEDTNTNTYKTYVTLGTISTPTTTARLSFTAASAILAPVFTVMALRSKNKNEKSEADEIMEKYGDIIIEGEVTNSKNNILINVRNFKKIAELSEIKQKPVIRQENEFILIDGGVMYRYEAKSHVKQSTLVKESKSETET